MHLEICPADKIHTNKGDMRMDAKYLDFIPTGDIYLFNIGAAQKAWLCYGCRYIPELNAHRFIVWAPNARAVSLVGDFNGWNREATPMELLEGGAWVCFVEGLHENALYKYCVTGKDGKQVLKSDPFATFSQNGEETASIVWNGGSYQWTDKAYMKKRAKRQHLSQPMSIYEVHLGSWKDVGYEKAQYRLMGEALAAYCKDMGYTHVELMPVSEYPYDGSWGYQVTGYYAPTSRYGNPDDFKCMVDTLHAAGIGVIIDWVPAHFPKDEHGLARFDGTNQFECKEQRMAEHPDWGTLIFDYASNQVQSFLISSACLFFEEYHVDGIRVDAVSSMLYLDYNRPVFRPNRYGGRETLEAMELLRAVNRAANSIRPGALMVAEESTAFPRITKPDYDGGLGFLYKWSMGWMNDTLQYMETDPIYRKYQHNKLNFTMTYAFSENFILPLSHDEVVHCKGSLINKMPGEYDWKFAGLRTLLGFQMAHPGKKLTFMGTELAQFDEWNYNTQLGWDLLEFERHRQLHEFVRDLNHFYLSHPQFWQNELDWTGFQWIDPDNAEENLLSFRRIDCRNREVLVICNFCPVARPACRLGVPRRGQYRPALCSDDPKYGGTGMTVRPAVSQSVPFRSYKLSACFDVPPMSVTFYLRENLPKKE